MEERFGSLLFWVPVGITFTDLVASIHQVRGLWMKPTFNPQKSCDYVLLDKLTPQFVTCKRGSVVTLRFGLFQWFLLSTCGLSSPEDPKCTITKRLIGIQWNWIRKQDATGALVHIPRGHGLRGIIMKRAKTAHHLARYAHSLLKFVELIGILDSIANDRSSRSGSHLASSRWHLVDHNVPKRCFGLQK